MITTPCCFRQVDSVARVRLAVYGNVDSTTGVRGRPVPDPSFVVGNSPQLRAALEACVVVGNLHEALDQTLDRILHDTQVLSYDNLCALACNEQLNAMRLSFNHACAVLTQTFVG